MIFIWRGTGITVPIFFFISAWLTSYWFDDVRFGNYSYVGWSMLWAGIALTLLGLAINGNNMPDPETGEEPQKTLHDFFWIPVIVWGLAFIGISIWLINKEVTPDSNESYEQEQNVDQNRGLQGQRELNFYNPTGDTLTLKMTDEANQTELVFTTIPPNAIRYKVFDPGNYNIFFDQERIRVQLHGTVNPGNTAYTRAWCLMDKNRDMVVVDVTPACSKDINETEIRAINWAERVRARYSGGQLIQPILTTDYDSFYGTVVDPGTDLPLEHNKSEHVYALIPISKDRKETDRFLDDVIVDLCY